jgi:hypothetical protein
MVLSFALTQHAILFDFFASYCSYQNLQGSVLSISELKLLLMEMN